MVSDKSIILHKPDEIPHSVNYYIMLKEHDIEFFHKVENYKIGKMLAF